jgi:hypothetical protein
MDTPRRLTTFGELEQQRLELRVACQRCGHEAVVDPASPTLRDRRLAGQRFRCSHVLASGEKCNGIGLPSIGPAGEHVPGNRGGLPPARRWPERLARHARRFDDK